MEGQVEYVLMRGSYVQTWGRNNFLYNILHRTYLSYRLKVNRLPDPLFLLTEGLLGLCGAFPPTIPGLHKAALFFGRYVSYSVYLYFLCSPFFRKVTRIVSTNFSGAWVTRAVELQLRWVRH